jgi:uncharacterized Zn finger protein
MTVDQGGAGSSHRWSKRLIMVLEGFSDRDRLHRGRAYADGGDVEDLDVRPGEVYASVRGTRRRPYSVTIRISVLTPEQWSRVERMMAARTDLYTALLEGRMPEHVEDVFHDTGLSLYPSRREFDADCTCPDLVRPCKHIAATCYVLADRFDRDPFDLMLWRGRRKVDLQRRLESLRDEQAWEQSEAVPEPEDVPLAETLGAFWSGAQPLPPLPPAPEDSRPGAVLDRLGPLGVGVSGEGDRGEPDLTELLRPAYEALARS